MTAALVVTLAFSGVEAAGGWWAGSLALLSDAGHMVTDAAALGLALFAQSIARRPPSARNGFHNPSISVKPSSGRCAI